MIFLETTAVVEPWVLESFSCRDTNIFLTEDLLDEVFSLVRNIVPLFSLHRELSCFDTLNDCLIRGTIEGRLTREQDVKDDTNAPNVTLFAVGARDDFWGDIVRRAEDTMHGMVVIDSTRGAKVDQLDDCVVLVLKVDVLRLNVTVNDTVLVQVVDGGDELLDHIGCLHFVEGVV